MPIKTSVRRFRGITYEHPCAGAEDRSTAGPHVQNSVFKIGGFLFNNPSSFVFKRCCVLTETVVS